MRRFENSLGSEEEFNKKLLNYENKSFHLESDLDDCAAGNSKFDSLEICKKIHPFIDSDELKECVVMIIEYYELCQAKVV